MPILSRFGREHPGVRLEVTSGLGPELMRLYRQGEFDFATGQADGTRRGLPGLLAGTHVLGRQPLNPALARDPLPLVVFPVGGLYRNEMLHHLEMGGWRWRINYSSASLASVCAAVAAGLGISLPPERVIRADHQVLEACCGLPDIQGVFLALYGLNGLSHAGNLLKHQLIDLCQALAQPQSA